MTFQKFHNWLLAGIFFLVFAPGLRAQTTFEAYAPVKQVIQGEYFNVSFTLLNADGSDFKPPKFTGFRIVNGPSRSVSTSIINGDRSSEMTHTYLLEAGDPGTYTIGSATIQVKGKVLRSNTLKIVVNARDQQSLEEIASDAEIFVRAIPSTTQAYPGQQVLIDYKLYSQVSVDHYSIASESEYPGFFAQPMRRFRGRTQVEQIGSKSYTTLVFRRVAVFPQVIDTLEISPIRLQVGLADAQGRNNFNPLISPRQVIALTSEPVKIAVLPLPSGTPESFCGGVGTFELRTDYDRSSLTTDDALTVNLTLIGNGDVKRLEAPAWMNNDSFEVYNPSMVDENIFENQGELLAQRTFEYQLIPRYPGKYTIQPQVAIFSPDSSSYVFLEGSKFSITVAPGSGRPRRQEVEEQAGQNTELVIRPLKTQVPLLTAETPFIQSNTYWILVGLAPFLLFIAWIIRQQRIRISNIDPVALRRSKAMKIAAQRLTVAKTYLDQGANREFFDETSKATLGFLTDRIGIPPASQKKTLIRQALESKGIDGTLIDRLLALLNQCELALFAGQADEGAKQEVYQEALEVLSSLAANTD
ncbi:MAG: protein BatD [Saprospiraceae bacterium]|nr:protein BatD [Saprospiraceae bacterium]